MDQSPTPTCPSAIELQRLLEAAKAEELDELIHSGSQERLVEQLRGHGIDLSSCDRYQVLKVVRETISKLSDDDLAQAAGGEIAKTTKAVLTATAVASTVVAVGVASGIGVGTALAVTDYNNSH